jgi:hypothetical protein
LVDDDDLVGKRSWQRSKFVDVGGSDGSGQSQAGNPTAVSALVSEGITPVTNAKIILVESDINKPMRKRIGQNRRMAIIDFHGKISYTPAE